MSDKIYGGYLIRECDNPEHQIGLPTKRPGGKFYIQSYTNGEETPHMYCRHFVEHEDAIDQVRTWMGTVGKDPDDEEPMTIEEYQASVGFMQEQAKSKLKQKGFAGSIKKEEGDNNE